MSEKWYQFGINLLMILATIFCVYPFLLLFSASLTDDMEIKCGSKIRL